MIHLCKRAGTNRPTHAPEECAVAPGDPALEPEDMKWRYVVILPKARFIGMSMEGVESICAGVMVVRSVDVRVHAASVE